MAAKAVLFTEANFLAIEEETGHPISNEMLEKKKIADATGESLYFIPNFTKLHGRPFYSWMLRRRYVIDHLYNFNKDLIDYQFVEIEYR